MIGDAMQADANLLGSLARAFALLNWHGGRLSAWEHAFVNGLAERFVAVGNAMSMSLDERAKLSEVLAVLDAADADALVAEPSLIERGAS
jgi:hypothetical protein